MICDFRKEYMFLSNFYECPFLYEGILFRNAEACFHSQKVLAVNERLKFKDLTASESKKLGRRVDLRSDWEDIKDDIMYSIVMAKFKQNESLKNKLLSTGEKFLLEGTTGWHDNYWGSCDCPKCHKIQGKNVLGEILMRVRKELG